MFTRSQQNPMRIENKILTELSPNHEREQLETATERVRMDTER